MLHFAIFCQIVEKIRLKTSVVVTGGGVYLDDRVLGSCRPAIFNLVVVQFFRKKKTRTVTFFP